MININILNLEQMRPHNCHIVIFNVLLGVQDLLQMSHNKLGQNVKLCAYDRFAILEEHTPSESTDYVSKEVPYVTALFAKKCEPSLREMFEKMHARIEFVIDDASKNAKICIKSMKGYEKVRNWKEECKAKLEQFLKDICSCSLSIKPELFLTLQELVKEKNSDPSLCMEFTEDQTVLNIAGYSEGVTNLVDKFKCIEDTELCKADVISLDAEKIAFVKQIFVDLCKNHPNINFTIINDHTIKVKGKKRDRDDFIQSLMEIKIAYTLVLAEQAALDVLSLSDDQSTIYRLLKKQEDFEHIQFAVYYDQKSHKFYIVANEQPIANKLARRIKETIHHIAIKIVGNAFDRHYFTQLCEQLKEQHVIDFIISSSEIEITGDKQDVKKAEEILKKYIQNKYFKMKKMKVSSGCWRFISEQCTEQWHKITDKSKIDPIYDVKITLPKTTDYENNLVFTLEGEESLITRLFEEITALIDSVCTNNPSLVFDHHPGLFEYLNTKEIKFMIRGLERDIPSCIEVAIKPDHTNNVCAGVTEEGKRIILVEGNIETFRVDVIVNAANKNLKHGGGVALALSKKGGSRIQSDSDNYVRKFGALSDGDAVIRDEVGYLPCKKIIHAVGPMWKNDGKVEKVLMKTCINSLNLASEFNSIAFPAICSGIFKFPVEVSANTMIQAFCTWSKDFPETPLSIIYIVVHNHAVSAFNNAIKQLLTEQLPIKVPEHLSEEVNTLDASSKLLLSKTPNIPSCKKEVKAYHHQHILPRTDGASVTKTTVPIKLYRGELLSQKV